MVLGFKGTVTLTFDFMTSKSIIHIFLFYSFWYTWYRLCSRVPDIEPWKVPLLKEHVVVIHHALVYVLHVDCLVVLSLCDPIELARIVHHTLDWNKGIQTVRKTMHQYSWSHQLFVRLPKWSSRSDHHIIYCVHSVHLFNSYSASHDNWCTATLWNRIMTTQCEGMGEVGSARYEPALLPPCPSIRALCYSNYQRSTQSHQQSKG